MKDHFEVHQTGSLYGIREIVAPAGHYITHQIFFETVEAAYAEIRRLKAAESCSCEKPQNLFLSHENLTQ
jgi:hypothetical protein